MLEKITGKLVEGNPFEGLVSGVSDASRELLLSGSVQSTSTQKGSFDSTKVNEVEPGVYNLPVMRLCHEALTSGFAAQL